MSEFEEGTLEQQNEFMKQVKKFYQDNGHEFKAPKFYGEPINCLKLYKAVVQLGGYEKDLHNCVLEVSKVLFKGNTSLIGTSPKWYKLELILQLQALLEYEKHQRQTGEIQNHIPASAPAKSLEEELEASVYPPPTSGRVRRESAIRAMLGWHQSSFGDDEVIKPIVKEKSSKPKAKREKRLKDIVSPRSEKAAKRELPEKPMPTTTIKELIVDVIDVGSPTDWVKISVRENIGCYEVYALVPGMLREEVHVQSDPAGHVIITGKPEHANNPWGIKPFKKAVILPGRINPLETTAIVSLHGRLYVRAPFEQGFA